MKMFAWISVVLVVLALLAGVTMTLTVYAQEKAEGESKIVAGTEVTKMVSLTGEVLAIDYLTREVVVKFTDGNKSKIVVGPDAYNFNQINVGDIVNIDLKESVALYVDRRSSEPEASTATTLVRAPKGQKPEGLAVTSHDATAKVLAIDYKERTVTLLGPDGNVLFITVPRDAAPNFDKIQKDDTVDIRYTAALAVKVEAKPKSK